MDFTLLGCDFTSAPTRRKPIVLAVGRAERGRVVLDAIERFESLDAWGERLRAPGPWVGGFDLPFGLPRELVQALGWPEDWRACMAHYAALPRAAIREAFAAFCQARPVGGKFAHRATDGPAGSSPSMKWVNPPVAFMMHAGVPRLIAAGAHLPGLLDGDPQRVALEAYPGLLARSVLGATSYKSDDKGKQTGERLIARKTLINALENGQAPLLQAAGLRLRLTHAQRDDLADDASGDRLDAVLCLLQAAWALQRHRSGDARWGLPAFDPLEGWIVGS
ncbi:MULTISPECIES: DUF429 domain-containing protein [Hydrogenophaga]|uniref:DUF429 domain-containing protein n=1 Tax=Hydrogenophaga intermedia TaxID=65786 RepID=A0A1L1PIN6_HYDIT|nr:MULTISPECIES: DUF429 domain-containing protein [Hydrogenophaga]AOS80462.1 DUF429 domain-containing protein [Hydrogenophaga sp. PBC]TMU78115.1 DUF429 domain-containing protein [Hydrogenophaga intermedia]CDN89270.1 hypothetical protein BN948_03707 [Hydrogenophaga intermedia]